MAKTLFGPYRLNVPSPLPVYVTVKTVKNINIRYKDDCIKVSIPPGVDEQNLKEILGLSGKKKSLPSAVKILGRPVPIDFSTVKKPVLEDRLILPERYRDLSDKSFVSAIDDVVKSSLDGYITNRLKFWQKRTGLYASSFGIRKMKTRWGSCTPATRRMRFNFYLTAVSPKATDSVVLHELIHLKIPNHQKSFYELLYSYLPDYDLAAKELSLVGTPVAYLLYGN